MSISSHFLDRAEAQIDEIYEYLRDKRSLAVAEDFLTAVGVALDHEIALLEAGLRRPLAPEAPSLRLDLFSLIVRGGGVWRLLYELLDDDQDGIIDRLQVFSIRSAHSMRIGEITPDS